MDMHAFSQVVSEEKIAAWDGLVRMLDEYVLPTLHAAPTTYASSAHKGIEYHVPLPRQTEINLYVFYVAETFPGGQLDVVRPISFLWAPTIPPIPDSQSEIASDKIKAFVFVNCTQNISR